MEASTKIRLMLVMFAVTVEFTRAADFELINRDSGVFIHREDKSDGKGLYFQVDLRWVLENPRLSGTNANNLGEIERFKPLTQYTGHQRVIVDAKKVPGILVSPHKRPRSTSSRLCLGQPSKPTPTLYYFIEMSINIPQDQPVTPYLRVSVKFSDIEDWEEIEVELRLLKESHINQKPLPKIDSPISLRQLPGNGKDPFVGDTIWMDPVLRQATFVSSRKDGSSKPTHFYNAGSFHIDAEAYDKLLAEIQRT